MNTHKCHYRIDKIYYFYRCAQCKGLFIIGMNKIGHPNYQRIALRSELK